MGHTFVWVRGRAVLNSLYYEPIRTDRKFLQLLSLVLEVTWKGSLL